MYSDDLITISNFFNGITRGFIPYSSNKPDNENQPFHRTFWLNLMRSRNDQDKTREKIRQMALDLTDDTVSESYPAQVFHHTFFNNKRKTNTLYDIYQYIGTLKKRELKTKHKDGKKVSDIEHTEAGAKNAIKYGIGNCEENADINFCLFLEYPLHGMPEEELPSLPENILLEEIGTKEGDHVFIVIGRDPNSDLKDISTWGPTAVILDSWTGEEGEVLHVATHLKHSISSCFEFILEFNDDLTIIASAYVGQGHSERWINKRTKKHEPTSILAWPQFFTENEERVDWVFKPDVKETEQKRQKP